MSDSYHHGSLRRSLIAEGRSLLEQDGLQAVTLRELARRAGVSHGAPRRHFKDREALLDALAAEGFAELIAALQSSQVPADIDQGMRVYAHTHVHFATTNPALMSLMFSRDLSPAADNPAAVAAREFFALGASKLGEQDGRDLGPLPFLLTATLEGISALTTAGRLPVRMVREVTDVAVTLLLPMVHQQLDAKPFLPSFQAGPS